MSEQDIRRYTASQLRQMKDESDWAELRRRETQGMAEDRTEDDFDVDWSRAVVVPAQQKTPVSLRIDPDILDFFKSQGKGYQTRMNAVLRAYMEAQKKAG